VCLQIKAKLAAEQPADDGGESHDDDEMQATTPSTQESTERPVILDVRPKRSSARATADEERLLTTLEERGRQSMQLQEKLIELIKPTARPTERSTYGDWAKSVMEDLDVSLWRQFQQDHSQLLYKYLAMHDRVVMGAQSQSQYRAQPPQQQQWQPNPAQQQQQLINQQTGSSQTQECPQWQPPPQTWPVSVQSTSVWNSQSANWVQSQMAPETTLTTLQPMTRSTPTNTSSSVPRTSATWMNEDVGGLSGILSTSFIDEIHRAADLSQK
jgi:hypothetical protein